jgi:hypothetical protein
MTEIQQDKGSAELIIVLMILGTALVTVFTVCLVETVYYGIIDSLRGKNHEM